MTSMFGRIKTRYRERHDDFRYRCEITFDYLLNLWNNQNGKCSATGIKMTHCFKNLNSVSIDRIDNLNGYVQSNVRLVCKWINTGRLNNNIDDFNKILLDYANNSINNYEYDKNHVRSYFRRILMNNIRSRCNSSKSKKDYNVTLDFLCDLFYKQHSKCIFTNQSMLIEQDKLNSCSVDRIDNSRGYMIDNIQLVCSWTNTARGLHSINDFKNVLNEFKSNVSNNLIIK